MIIAFREHFALPIEAVFEYFATPTGWVRLYGFGGRERALGDGWHRIPLRHFPFPLVVKVTACEPNELVRWTFRGFWRGAGEVRFRAEAGVVAIWGYETISVRWLFFLSPLLEKAFLEARFQSLWHTGWRRLRQMEAGAVRPSDPWDGPGPRTPSSTQNASHRT